MTTTTWDKIKALYDGTEHCFESDLEHHIRTGYVFSGPDYFLMGYPVDDYGWVVSVGIGNMGKLISLIPYPLPYIGFSRDPSGNGTIKWYDSNKLIKHYENQAKSKQ